MEWFIDRALCVAAVIASGVCAGAGTVLAVGNSKDSNKNPDSVSKLQSEVNKGQAPKEVKRVDRPHNPNVANQKPHVHFKDVPSLNNDGTVHDAHKGIPNLSKETLNWLQMHGWRKSK